MNKIPSEAINLILTIRNKNNAFIAILVSIEEIQLPVLLTTQEIREIFTKGDMGYKKEPEDSTQNKNTFGISTNVNSDL